MIIICKSENLFAEEQFMIICITGLPGSGKSTVAELLKQEMEGCGRKVRHFTSDWMRHKLFPELVPAATERGRDFTPDELERSYNGLYMLFEELLRVDPTLVILTDGTYRTESQRSILREMSRHCNVGFFLIKVWMKEEAALTRFRERLASGAGSGPESYFSAKAAYEEPTDAFVLGNTGNKKALQKKVSTLSRQLALLR